MGGGWNTFTRLFSPGGDVILAMKANGELFHYRYREDTRTLGVHEPQGRDRLAVDASGDCHDRQLPDGLVRPRGSRPPDRATDRPGVATAPNST